MKRILPLFLVLAAVSALAANNPPVVTTDATNGAVGVAFSYQIIATNSPTSYTASPLPPGLSLNTNTGLISGTPTTTGTYTVAISATNNKGTGNGTLTITINNPVPTTTSLSPSSTIAGSPQFTLTVNGTKFVSTSTVYWNGSPLVTTFSSATQLTAIVPAANVAATGTANVTVVNPAPGGGTSNAQTFTINPPPPVITSSLTATGQVAVAFSYTITATNSPTSYNAAGLPPGLSVNTSTGLISGTPTTAGTYSVAISATNAGGMGTATLTITINPAPPVITSSLTATGQVGVAFSYTISASNSPTSYNAAGLPTGLSVNTSTGVISGTPATGTDTGSPYSVTISATNAGGTGTATLTLTINPRAPVVQPPLVATGEVELAFSYQINANNNPTSFDATGLPPGLTVDTTTGLISGTPTAAGIYSVTISASNAGGTNTKTLTLTIKPHITSPLTATATATFPFSYQITADDTDSKSTYSAPGLPSGLSVGAKTGLISGTPAAGTDAGSPYSVTLKVTTNGATGTATLILTVKMAPPVITSPLAATGTVGVALSYQITASNGPTSFNATGLPAGLTVNTSTGLISGTSTGVGIFTVTISATNAGGTGNAGLTLTINFPPAPSVPPFPGQLNDFDTGSANDPSNSTITFPNTTTDNYFTLYWNGPGATNQNLHLTDSARGGLQRNQNLSPGMRYNPYTPGTSKPDPAKNVWRGNPSPPSNNSSGQFGDPRASWYITDPWPAADYVAGSYWGGPTSQMSPLTWPDSGHPFDPLQVGKQPSGPGQTPVDIMAGPTPTPASYTKSISRLSTSTSGNLASLAELGNVFDPAQLSYAVTNPGGALPDIPTSATLDSKGGGGHTLAIGRPEFSKFDTNGMRAWQLLDVLSAASGTTIPTTNTAGLVNINTASRDVLRALAAGILQNQDPAIQPSSLTTSFYPPTVSKQADLFADAVINSRPLLSTSALSTIRVTPPGGSQPEPFFGNPHQYNNQTQPSEWNDAGREELFAKILNLATTRSRNFRVFVTGQSLDKNGNVLSTVTKVYQVFVKPNRAADGTIQSQQVVIKYEGSM